MDFYDKDKECIELAIEKEKENKKYIQNLGNTIGISQSFIDFFGNEGIVYIIDDEIDDFVYNHNNPTSLKPGNMFVDMKKTCEALAFIGAGFNVPKNWSDAAQLILLVVLNIKDIVNIKLPQGSSEIFSILIRENKLDEGIGEDELMHKVMSYYADNRSVTLDKERFYSIINFMEKYSVISILDGKIFLQERIYGKNFYEKK